ncbi:MAG: hypothetical protein DHS20C01_25130 [marine bacterium B5-7]|nr:MAG: hypothetical protein DHS20C01_25130 [marine bacterium B5-7]
MPKPQPTAADILAAHDRLKARLEYVGADARIVQMLRVGSGSRPHVAVVIIDRSEYVIKDHAGADPGFAYWLGPMLARREVRALTRLKSLCGVPKILQVIDKRAFVMSKFDAVPYRQQDLSESEWASFFEKMQRLVDGMHRLGVAHCDLRSPDNTLMTVEGQPVIVDFVASYTRKGRWNFISRWIFNRMCEVDRSAIDKQKRTVCPALLDADAAVVEREGYLARLARGTGVLFRNASRFLLTGRGRN